MRERYPGLDILSQQDHRDRATRELILDRLYNVPRGVKTLRAVIGTVMPQDNRPPERRIPILNYVDQPVYEGTTPGCPARGRVRASHCLEQDRLWRAAYPRGYYALSCGEPEHREVEERR